MVKTYKRKSTRASWTEEALENAMAKVRNKELGVNEASKEYGIPSRTLRRHCKTGKGKSSLGRAPVLGQEHEKRIVTHIKALKKAGFSPDRNDVKAMAYLFAQELNIKHRFSKEKESAGDDWFYGFLRRNKELKSEGLSLARAQGMNRKDEDEFFGSLQQTLIDNDVKDLIVKTEAAEANLSVSSVSSQSVTASGMPYGTINYGIHDYAKEKNAIIVDLRSDALTKPTAAMRKAMFEAEVGDDVLEEDPTVKELQKKAAEFLGKEDALFVSSGTMGNLIAVMNHCDVRGSEVYCGSQSHVFLHERGGVAQIAGASICTLPNNDDGTFDLKSLESAIRVDRIHEPISKLVMVENTINGIVVPQSWIEELAIVAKKHNLKMHLDGARLWNSAVASKISAKDLAAPFDSVTFCLSKGLGAPVGSVLCGSESFIANARRRRKVLGGAMGQVGVIAAAGIVALEQTVPRLVEDHRRAMIIAEAINQLDSKIFSVDLKTTHTNMIFVNVNTDSGVSAGTLMKRLQQVNDFNADDKIIIRCLAVTEKVLRMVVYYDIDESMVTAAIRKLRYVIKQLDSQVKI